MFEDLDNDNGSEGFDVEVSEDKDEAWGLVWGGVRTIDLAIDSYDGGRHDSCGKDGDTGDGMGLLPAMGDTAMRINDFCAI